MNFQKNKNLRKFFILGGFLFFSWLNCHKPDSSEARYPLERRDSQKKNKIILEVAGLVYLNSDFKDFLRSTVGEDVKSLTAPVLSRLYDRFVEEKIFLKKAQNQKISLTDEEKKDYLAKLKNEFWPENENELNSRALSEKLLIEKYLYLLIKDLKVDEDEIAEYYRLHRNEFFRPESVQVSQILVESERKANEILNKLKGASEEDFRNLARQESAGPEASKGGVMGVFRQGQLPFEIEKVVFALGEGEVSHIVKSSYGFHVFKLDKRYEPKLISEEEAIPAIKAKILDRKISQVQSTHLEELKKNMNWKSYPQNLFFPYQRNVS